MLFEAEYYQTLGIKSNATDSEIKTAFKKKAMELHPDKNRNDPKATEKFQKLNEAYETLKDPNKKKEYDLKHQPKKQTFNTSEHIFGANIEDLLRDIFGSNQTRSRTSYYNFFDDSDDDDFDDLDSDEDSDSDEINTLFIGSLPRSTLESDLLKAFASFNPYRVKVVDNSFSKPPFGFVQFFSSNDMRKAFRERPNVFINGKICRAKISHSNLYERKSRRRYFF